MMGTKKVRASPSPRKKAKTMMGYPEQEVKQKE